MHNSRPDPKPLVLITVPFKRVFMEVMIIVHVSVSMCNFVMIVLVVFGQVQPKSGTHQRRSHPEKSTRRFPD